MHDHLSCDGHKLTRLLDDSGQLIGIADFSLRYARGLETNTSHRACTIQSMTVNHEEEDLARMTVFSMLLQCIRDHCKMDDVQHLAIPLPPGSMWFAKFLGPGGFQLCTCWYPYQLSNSTQLCLCIPGLRRNAGGPAGEGKLLTQAVAVSPHNDPARTFLDNLDVNLPLSPPLPASRRPSIQGTLSKKEYCMHWIKTGECNYMQQGCKYKHRIPTDPEVQQRIGLRKMPEWVLESRDPERFMERPERSGARNLENRMERPRPESFHSQELHARKRRFGS